MLVRYAFGMSKKRKIKWDRKFCGCVKTELAGAGRVLIRCTKHRGKPAKGERTLCYFDDHGLIQRETPTA